MNIANIEKTVNNFTINISLQDDECGWIEFNDKWTVDKDGPIKGDNQNFDCNWYNIGQLNKGNDVTKASAQKEFNRDCYAFDVSLVVTISKNNIDLINETIIGSNYHYDDSTPEECLLMLSNDYYDENELIKQAQDVLKSLCDCTTH